VGDGRGLVLVTVSAIFMVWAARAFSAWACCIMASRLDLKSMLRAVRTGAEG